MMEVGFDIKDYQASADRYLAWLKRERERLAVVSRDTRAQRLAESAQEMFDFLEYVLECAALPEDMEARASEIVARIKGDL